MSMTSAGAQGGGFGMTPPETALEMIGPNDRSKRKFELSRFIGPPIVLVIFVAVWQYMHTSGMRKFFDKPGFLLPSPFTVVNESFVHSLARDKLLNGVKWTAVVSLIGLAFTIVVGMLFAVVMAQAKWAERSFYPYLVALQAVPILAIVPIILSVFGTGLLPRLFVCAMIAFFPIVTNTLFGLQSADVGQHDLFTLRGANRWTRLWKLQVPAALPAVFTGFRISAGLSVIGAIVGEQFFRGGSKPGIGIVMESYRQKAIYPQVYGGIILGSALGIAFFLIFGWLGRKAVGHWYEASGRS
ncbi:MAG: putative transporter permease protein [Ilumatobacteraceae bacterium]|nr:putative transporter permease protein [Ilumatobacteraceae bacterium]